MGRSGHPAPPVFSLGVLLKRGWVERSRSSCYRDVSWVCQGMLAREVASVFTGLE